MRPLDFAVVHDALQAACDDAPDGWADATAVVVALLRQGCLTTRVTTRRVRVLLDEHAKLGRLEDDPLGTGRFRPVACKFCARGHARVPLDLCEPARREFDRVSALGDALGITAAVLA